MNTSVEIGSSQDYRLKQALLVYGENSYNGYPYRHPFLTVHDVIHEGDEAHLGEGQLVTPSLLIRLMEGLGQAMPVEILPERVLVRTREIIVWWSPPERRLMFFSDRCGGDAALKRMNGRMYPHPALLFKVAGSRLWVRALARDERPKAETKLSMAPYWNCSDDGAVCLGSMRIPRQKSVAQIEAWEQSSFHSEFTHAGGVRRHTRYRGGFMAMWQLLEGTGTFPSSYLVRLKESLADFVCEKKPSHRHAQRNE